jgi:hypothetical protein
MDVATSTSTLLLNAIAVVPPDFTSGFIGKERRAGVQPSKSAELLIS